MLRLLADRLVRASVRQRLTRALHPDPQGQVGLRSESPRWVVRIRQAFVTLVCAFVIFSPKLAIADDATDARARARYQEGVRLFDAGKFEEAHEAFLDAYRLKPHPGVLRNLGAVEARLGRRAEAARHLARFLRESSDVAASDRADVEHKLADLERALGRLRFRVAPDGAAVAVDGEPVANSPIAYAYHVDPGSHVVRASADNRAAEEQTVVAEPGQVVDVVLELKAAASGSTSAAKSSPSSSPSAAASGVDQGPMRDRTGHNAERRSIVPALIGGALFVAGVAVGVGFRVASANKLDDADAMKARLGPNPCGTGTPYVPECAEIRDTIDTARTDQNVSTAGFVTAGVALVATAVYWFWPSSSGDQSAAPSTSRGRAAISPVLAPGIAGATLRATF